MIKILALLIAAITTASKLVYLSELYRHGARYPVNDIYDGKETKPLHGQLTGIGMRQHYLLGSYLRKDYLNELGLRASFDPTEVQVFVDGSQRCLQSAYAHMAGWFPLGQGEEIPSSIDPSFLVPPFKTLSNLRQGQKVEEPAITSGYQPIPVKVEKAFFPNCPNQAKLIQKRAEVIAPLAALLQAQQTQFMLKIRKIFNLSIAEGNIPGMLQLYDTVVCDLNLGRKLPSQFTEQQLLELKFIQNYLFVLLYADHLAKVESTPIAHSVIDKMQLIIDNKFGNKKFTVYSAHDTNVAPMLTFLNLTSAECVKKKYKNQTVNENCAEPVPFASSIQWELHLRQSQELQLDQRDPSNYFVKIRYNGDYYQLCQKKSTECDFPQFSSRIRASLVDFNKQCGVK